MKSLLVSIIIGFLAGYIGAWLFKKVAKIVAFFIVLGIILCGILLYFLIHQGIIESSQLVDLLSTLSVPELSIPSLSKDSPFIAWALQHLPFTIAGLIGAFLYFFGRREPKGDS
ncbi:MAG: hypothetical protein V1799_06095 [bacterium]